MSRSLLATLALLVGMAAFSGGVWLSTKKARSLESHSHRELEWLRHEFGLGDEQFRRVAELHLAFMPRCDALCDEIMAKGDELSRMVLASGGVTPEIERALDEAGRLHVRARQEVLDHLYAVSGEMPTPQAERYVRMMLPLIIDTPYAGYPGEDLRP